MVYPALSSLCANHSFAPLGAALVYHFYPSAWAITIVTAPLSGLNLASRSTFTFRVEFAHRLRRQSFPIRELLTKKVTCTGPSPWIKLFSCRNGSSRPRFLASNEGSGGCEV